MKNKLIITGFLACVGLLVLWQATKQQNTSLGDTLVVGTHAQFPPFEFVQNDEIVGFDMDLIKIIGEHLGKKIELKNVSFDALIPGAQMGSIQVIAAGMTPTPERAKRILFTKPHTVGDPLCILTLAKNRPFKSVDELVGKKVAVPEGYMADFYISNIQGVDITRLQTMAEGILALTSGRVDAFIAAENSIKPFFDQRGKENFNITIIPETGDSYALGISKKHPELLGKIQQILDVLEKNGTLKKLKAKWKMTL